MALKVEEITLEDDLDSLVAEINTPIGMNPMKFRNMMLVVLKLI